MAEDIRNVVIKIGLVQSNNTLKAPDVNPYLAALRGIQDQVIETEKKFQSLRDKLDTTHPALHTMHTSFADILEKTSKLPANMSNFRKEVEGASDAAKALQDNFFAAHGGINESALKKQSDLQAKLAKENEEYYKRLDKLADNARRELEEYNKRLEEQRDKLVKNRTEAVNYSLKMVDGFRSAADGAFAVARGMTFLGMQNNEVEKVVKTIAAMQGSFDIIKGSIDVVKGGVQGVQALRAATTAYAAAQTAAAAATAASGAAATAAVPGFTALTVAMGPVGLLTAGITASVATLGTAYYMFTRSAKGASEEFIAQQKRLRAEADLTAKLVSQRFDMTRQHIDLLHQVNRTNAEAQFRDFTSMARDAHAALEQAVLGLNQKFSSKDEADAAAQVLDAAMAVKHWEEQRLGTIEKINAAKQTEIERARQSLDLTKQQLDTERSLKESIAERFGRLDNYQQSRVKLFNQKLASGEKLTDSEVREYERHMGATPATQQHYIDKGLTAGAPTIMSPSGFDTFNVDNRIAALGQSYQRETQTIEQMQKEMAKLAEYYREKEKEIVQSLIETLKREFVTKGVLEDLMSQIEIGLRHTGG